jgi:hypothetical protein
MFVKRDILLSNTSQLDDIITENAFTRDISSDQLLLQQDKMLVDQDKGIETLSTIVRSQKQIAVTIGNEVDKQNRKLNFNKPNLIKISK